MLAENRKYTTDEYFAMNLEYNEHCELVNGEIVAFASPTAIHQRIIKRVGFAIDKYILDNKGKCEVFLSPFDVVVDDYNVVQPDVFIVCDPSKVDDKRCNGIPDFIVEVLSTNRKDDLIRKLTLYSDYGVREYWIVDPENKKVLVYFFEKSDLPDIYTFDADIPVGIYGGKLSINIADLLA